MLIQKQKIFSCIIELMFTLWCLRILNRHEENHENISAAAMTSERKVIRGLNKGVKGLLQRIGKRLKALSRCSVKADKLQPTIIAADVMVSRI